MSESKIEIYSRAASWNLSCSYHADGCRQCGSTGITRRSWQLPCLMLSLTVCVACPPSASQHEICLLASLSSSRSGVQKRAATRENECNEVSSCTEAKRPCGAEFPPRTRNTPTQLRPAAFYKINSQSYLNFTTYFVSSHHPNLRMRRPCLLGIPARAVASGNACSLTNSEE